MRKKIYIGYLREKPVNGQPVTNAQVPTPRHPQVNRGQLTICPDAWLFNAMNSTVGTFKESAA